MKQGISRAARFAAVIAAAFIAPANLGALTIKNIMTPAPVTYSPDAKAQTTGRVRVWHDGYTGPFAIIFTELSLMPRPASPADKLSYGLWVPDTSPTYRLSLTGFPASANEMFVGYFPPPNESKKPYLDAGFAVIVSPETMPPPGTYVATIRADLYNMGYPASGPPADSLTFSVSVNVPSIADLSLVPKGGAFSVASTSASLSFGVIASGATRDVDLLIRSNVRYSVALTSASGGALVDSTGTETIPYALTANGVPLALSPGSAGYAALNADPTYGKSVSHAITVTIGAFTNLPIEGTYSDLITVNVLGP